MKIKETKKSYIVLNKWNRTLSWTLTYGGWLALALAPLWVWLSNGYSIDGGIADTPLSFGLAFIGTFISLGGTPVTFKIFEKSNEEWF